MNQTQKNYAVKRIKDIFREKRIQLFSDDRKRFEEYEKATGITIDEIVTAIHTGKITPARNKKLIINSDTHFNTAFPNFAKKLAKASKLEKPLKKDYYVGGYGLVSFKSTLAKKDRLAIMEKEFIDQIMLGDHATALDAIARAEKYSI